MPHTTIETNGSIVYRTQLFSIFSQALSFTKCLAANERFSDVTLHRSETAKTPKWFVTFQPANPLKRGDLYLAEWNKNEKKADEQGGDFVFWQDPDNDHRSWVFNPISGATYEMTDGCCSCPHKVNRLTNAALHCKHEIERDRRFQAGTLYGTDKQSQSQEKTASERADWVASNRDLDF
jgi:hypothetical protein